MIVDVVIPALNEEDAIGLVIGDIPKNLVRNIYVVDNASTDNTAGVAERAGAIVVKQNERGYGAACLAGIERIKNSGHFPDILVFLDGDYSDHPEQMPQLTARIEQNQTDMVIGSRALGNREAGSMMPQQVFGNWLATFLIRLFYGFKYSDLGPFRAIRWSALEKINMQDRDFGWTVEMQIKALKHQLKIEEIPVDYRQRKGHSKIAGTVKGTIMAGYKIIYTIFKYAK